MTDRVRRRKLARLARRMQRLNETRLPINDALLDCFDMVIAPRELEALLAVGDGPTAWAETASRAGLGGQEAPEVLKSLRKKDLVSEGRADGATLVELVAFMPGWFESQLFDGGETPYHQEFARRIDRLFESWRRLNVFPARPLINLYYRLRTRPSHTIAAPAGTVKTIEVGRDLETKPYEIHPTAVVARLVEEHGAAGSIGLVYCFCRQWRKLMGQPCRFKLPHEACLTLGRTALTALERGVARKVTRDEALAILAAAQKGGAVHTVFHERDDTRLPEIAICSCCWDCCGAFGAYNRGGAALHFQCGHRARIASPEDCTRCGACVRFCPVEALTLGEEGLRLDSRRCIGCGQCAFRCAAEVLVLVADPREVVLGLRDPKGVRIR